MTAPPNRLLAIALAVLIGSSLVADVQADDPSDAFQAIQAQLAAAKKEQRASQKQIALQTAAVAVAKKRSVDLEKQLKESQQRAAVAAKAIVAARTAEAASAKKITTLDAKLQQHQKVDGLLAVAAAVNAQVDAATVKHEALLDQLAEIRKAQFDQQQLGNKAASQLKTAQEQLPKTKEELTKARATFDAVGKELDVARLAMSEARRTVRTREAAVQPERVRLPKAQAALAQVNASVMSLQESLNVLQAAAKATGGDPVDAGAELSASIAALKPLQQRATELVAAVDASVVEAQKQVAAGKTALAAAETKFREQQARYAEQSSSHFKLQLQVADLQNADKLHQKQIADATAAQEQIATQQKELEPKIAVAAAEVEKLRTDYVSKQQIAEAAMEPLGRFVSFSKHIAPIFAKRCVACHNTRTASGRLNMNSFATLAKGGESGAAFAAHDADSSMLWAMIDDESMPKDADPLTKEENALIRQWIDVGAPLDAGVVATADLFQVMPEIAQPLPPKTYRVAIPVTATAFTQDGTILASSGYHEILLWKTDDGSLIRRITNVAERVYDLEFSKDGAQLAVAAGTPGQLGEVKLFSVADGKHQKTLVRTTDAVFAVSYSPDGKFVAAAGADRIVYAMDIATGETTQRIEDHADWVMDVNWSPDGKQLVTASRDKTAKVFEVATGRSVTTFNGHGNAVYSVAFLIDGKSVVSAGSDRQARVWNPADAKEIRRIGGFGSDIFRITVTPENHLLSASADKNAREHNLADGKVIRTFSGHKDWVYTLCYNPQRKLIATGSYDGEIRVWNSSDGSVATSFIAIPKAAGDATVAAAQE
ncbi:MAG: hypothetical protein GY903_24125 [Fuerstiella sp.]|nr:hypothetical protein [Fuerstiella sp.]MCP4857582.1 hypothetical protein [Fuerstiella sp.]